MIQIHMKFNKRRAHSDLNDIWMTDQRTCEIPTFSSLDVTPSDYSSDENRSVHRVWSDDESTIRTPTNSKRFLVSKLSEDDSLESLTRV